MVTIIATEANPYKKTGLAFECTTEAAATLIKKGFAVADGEEPKQPAKPKEPKQPKTTKQ